ncbi:MAG: molybdopterin-dependent oxidoreductase [Acidobacteriota bacterium]
MKILTSACPRDCYSTCSFRVSLRDGRIGLIEPHPGNKATGEGVCLKGLSYAERVYHPDRILHPLKKTDGTFKRISWDEALSDIENNIRDIHKNYGPGSILYYAATGTKGILNGVGKNFWEKTGGCSTTYGDLCWPTGLEATRLTLGDNIHNAPWDIENAGLIIMWGKNGAETNVHQMKYIEKAQSKGSKFIVIDPRRTESAARADMLISPKPGSDGALALGIANLLIKKDHVDNKFISNNVYGYEEFRTLVEKYSPEVVSEITDVPEVQIYEIAEMIGKIKPVTISAGFGMQRYSNSGQTMRSMISLLAITGNIGIPGGGWVYANLQSHIFDEVKDPLAFYPPEKQAGNINYSVPVASVAETILTRKDPPVKMIWVERGNPITQNPDTNLMIKAFRSLNYVVVIDQFLTDTAREADLVLPSKTMFEQSDIINAYWHSYIQLKQKIIDPPGEVKPESEIYYLLAKRMGINNDELKGKIPEPNDEAVENFLKEKLKKFPGITLGELKKGPLPAPGSKDVAFDDLIFKTPSGKIEIYSEEAVERWGVDELPQYKEPDFYKNKEKYPFMFMTPNTKNRIHSQFGNLSHISQFASGISVFINPIDASEKNIREKEDVTVFNDRGELKGKAVFDFGLKKGCIVVTNGWWLSEGGCVNSLSEGKETDMGYGAAFHETMVNIKRGG